jgi:hypothetical protein
MRRDKPARYKTGGIMKSRLLRLLIYVIVAGAVSLAALEVGLRLYVKATVLTFRDWRGANSMALESGGKYDEVLGWVQPAHLVSDGFNTVEYGIRKNSSRDEPLSRDAVLAVGDSYTVGSEVRDDESWPAQLERLAEIGVINAGVLLRLAVLEWANAFCDRIEHSRKDIVPFARALAAAACG